MNDSNSSNVTIQDGARNRQVSIRPQAPQQASQVQVSAADVANMPGLRVEQHRNMQVNASDFYEKRTGLLATATTKGGDHARNLTPDTLIHIPTSSGRTVPMRLSMAEAEGYVTRDEKGNYQEVAPETRAATLKAAQQAEHEAREAELRFPESLTEYTDGFLGDLHTVMKGAGVNPDSAIIQAFLNPEQFEATTLLKLIKDASPEGRAAVMTDIRESFRETIGQVQSMCKAEGVDFDGLTAWLDLGIVGKSRWVNAGLQAIKGNAQPMRAIVRQFKQHGGGNARVPEGVNVMRTPGRQQTGDGLC